MASISRIRIAWLRLLRSFRPVVAVRLDLVPRATRAATAAAELTGTRSPVPPDKKTPREGCSRTSILVDGGGGGGVDVPPVSEECRALLCGVLLCLPAAAVPLLLFPEEPIVAPSKRLWKTLLYISTNLWFWRRLIRFVCESIKEVVVVVVVMVVGTPVIDHAAK